MTKAAKSLAAYRRRKRREGFVRVEIQAPKEDAELIRAAASALSDPERRRDAAAVLRRHFGEKPKQNLKAVLGAAPLEGIDLERSRDTGREIDF